MNSTNLGLVMHEYVMNSIINDANNELGLCVTRSLHQLILIMINKQTQSFSTFCCFYILVAWYEIGYCIFHTKGGFSELVHIFHKLQLSPAFRYLINVNLRGVFEASKCNSFEYYALINLIYRWFSNELQRLECMISSGILTLYVLFFREIT